MTRAQDRAQVIPAITLLLLLAACAYLTELAFVFAYPHQHRPQSVTLILVAGPALISLLFFPPAFLFVLRPMMRQIAARDMAYEDLAASMRDLENRIEEQTSALESEIIEREQSAEALRLFRALMDQLSDGIEVLDPATGSILDVNETSCKVLGYTRDELLKLRVMDFDPLVNESSFAKIAYQVSIADTTRLESVHRRKDGTTFPVEVTLRHVSFGRDYMVSVARDITERVRAEEERKRLEMAIEHAAEAIVITDVHGAMTYVNPAFERITGYTRIEVLGKNPRILKSGKQDNEFYRRLWETITCGNVWRGCVTNKRKDGSLYEEDATISPVRDNQGSIIAYVAIKRDISEQLNMEAQLRQSQKMEAIGGLAAGIAHDFNNILSAILGYTQLAMMHVESQADVAAHLDRVEKASIRARDLVQQILTFSRQAELVIVPTDLRVVVGEVLKLLRASLPSTIEFREHLVKLGGTVRADPTQIHQVVMNLCVNAAHAMREEGGVLEVSLAEVNIDANTSKASLELQPGRWARISVSDTGHGMDASTAERIFEPFFSTKQDEGGTGLGLSTVHGIVKQHGGIITVYSEPDRGSVFHVYLPLTDATPESADERNSATPFGNGERVLVVDDEEPLATMASQMLTELGYSVTALTDPLRALEVFAAQPDAFDLVFTDYAMPTMTGGKLIAALRKIRPDIAVLMATGYDPKLDDDAAGGAGVLLKPVLFDRLAVAVHLALRRDAQRPV